jgi:hypothetical protein
VTGQIQEMEMIRQKVYQLEQAQIKIKAEYVHDHSFWMLFCINILFSSDTKMKFESCATSSNRAVSRLSHRMSAARLTQDHHKLLQRWDMVQITFLEV